MVKGVVAIVGRPNVGKSTFFNRCVGSRSAIVDDQPGVTRDRIYREAEWSGSKFLIVDTGGILPGTAADINSSAQINEEVNKQVRLAIDESDVIVFIVDGKQGPIGVDEDIAHILRQSKKPVLLAVNKIDTPKDELNVPEFYSLGLGEPHSLSAMVGSGGVGDLLDLVIENLPKGKKGRISEEEEFADGEEEDLSKKPFSLALVGKPNVGKSSLLNILCGADRTIVSDEPGTTRDAIHTIIKHNGREITLIDTAGIRRRTKVEYGIEAFSVVRSFKAISNADVVVQIIDSSEPISDQDQKIASKIAEAGRGVVIVMNKWDLFENKSSTKMNELKKDVEQDLRAICYAPVLFTSATEKVRVGKIIEAAGLAFAQNHRRVTTSLLNQSITECVALVPPPAGKRGKRLKIYYATQVSVGPPTFALFVNDTKLLTDNYRTYLERKLRENFGFEGTPIRILTRPKKKQ